MAGKSFFSLNKVQDSAFFLCKALHFYFAINSKLESGVKDGDLKEQQNEIIESVLYSIMELIDGYNDELSFPIDLIEKDTGKSLKGDIELHDKFIDYLNEVEND